MATFPISNRLSSIARLSAWVFLPVLGIACSSGTKGGAGGQGSGGASGLGGASLVGGALGTGGVIAKGGAPGSGGAAASGGATGPGGGAGSIAGKGGAIGGIAKGGAPGAGGIVGGGAGHDDGSVGSGGSTDGGTTPATCDSTAPATGIFAAPTGSGSACTLASPCSAGTALGKASSNTPVYLRGGTYSNTSYLGVSASGTADKYVIVSAYPCELPIIDPGSLALNGEYISVRGIVTRNSAGGFGNKWVGGGATNSNGHLEFINCIADMHSRNGIAFYSATGVHIKQSIVAHTGFSTTSSWSSGVNIFGAQGTYQDNLVEQNVAFENMDNQKHTDGSGFIVDDVGTGTTFRNNIGFRNGGSCIRLTTTTGTHIINNSCYGNGLDPAATGPSTPDEIFFSSSATTQGAVVYNNIAVATGKGGDTQAIFGGNGATMATNLTNNTGAITMWVDAAGIHPDFYLTTNVSAVFSPSTATELPPDDIGFDPNCITKTAPTGTDVPSWWLYSIDYDYIKSIGGVAQCFHPKARSGPSLGAYAP
jgi:hypothetical protein